MNRSSIQDPSRGRHLVAVGLFCFTVLMISATWFVPDFRTPNASTKIARNILEKGRYEGGYWALLKGRNIEGSQHALRLFQLPGEALYLAFWFRLLPEWIHPYIHVPITTIFVISVAYVASVAGGNLLGLFTGIFASVRPFIVKHGPVWDDTFLAAALVWTVIAMLCSRAVIGNKEPVSASRLSVLACAVAFASVTRVEAQIIFLLLAAATIVVPTMRKVRVEGVIIVLSMVVALGAWGFRNLAVVGEFTISSSHDGVVLLLSNGPYARQALRYGQVDGYVSAETMGVHWAQTADMTETEANKYFRREAIKYMVTHPMEVFSTAVVKLLISLAGIRPEESWVTLRNVIAVSDNVIVFVLALWGLYALKLQVSRQVYVMLWCVFSAIALAVFSLLLFGPIGLRYRITLDGILWIASSATILHWVNAIKGPPGCGRGVGASFSQQTQGQ